jgi:DnaJ-class molecular chaperone
VAEKLDSRACPDCGGSGEGPDELEFGNECVQKPCRTCKGSGLAVLDVNSSYPYKLESLA